MSEDRWEGRYIEGDTPWDSGRPSAELMRVVEGFSVPISPALELGCGTGTNAVWLASRGFQVTAVDVSATAIQRARERARAAGVEVDFRRLDLKQERPDIAPVPFVFDRGTYHVLRQDALPAWLSLLSAVTSPGSLYLTLTGNSNEPSDLPGPPRVHAHELCAELQPLFDLVELREFRWSDVHIDGRSSRPLGWAALLRRR